MPTHIERPADQSCPGRQQCPRVSSFATKSCAQVQSPRKRVSFARQGARQSSSMSSSSAGHVGRPAHAPRVGDQSWPGQQQCPSVSAERDCPAGHSASAAVVVAVAEPASGVAVVGVVAGPRRGARGSRTQAWRVADQCRPAPQRSSASAPNASAPTMDATMKATRDAGRLPREVGIVRARIYHVGDGPVGRPPASDGGARLRETPAVALRSRAEPAHELRVSRWSTSKLPVNRVGIGSCSCLRQPNSNGSRGAEKELP